MEISFQLRQFFDEFRDQLGGGLRSVQQSIERAERNVEWMDKNYYQIQIWLKEQTIKA